MFAPHRPASRRARLEGWLLVLVLGLALPGCEAPDPLVAVRQQQMQGDFESGLGSLRELLIEQPGNAEANYLYGRALVATRRPSLATWSLRQAMEDPEWREPAGMQLAIAGLITTDYNEVITVTTRLLEDDPEHAHALLLRAQAQAHWRRDPEAALADADRVLELDPEMIEAYEPRILALLALDRQEEATESLAEAGRRMAATDPPESMLAWHCATTAAFLYEAEGEGPAREKWDECLERHPFDSTVVGEVVQFYDAHGELDRSIEVLRAVVEEMPTARGYRNALAQRLSLRGEQAAAEALLREATRAEDPNVAAAAWADVATFRFAAGENAAAAEALERAAELAREGGVAPPQLMLDLADAHLLAGDLDRALEVGEELSVPVHRTLIRARVMQERGDHAGALEAFDEALGLWPNNPTARYYAGRAAESLGDFERALEEYRYVIRIDIGATDARTRAARLLIAEGRFNEAYGMLFFQTEEHPLEPAGQLLSLYLIARAANPTQLHSALERHRTRHPQTYPAALARAAEGASERIGAGAGFHLLSSAPGIDLANPAHAPVLREFVRFAHGSGEASAAERAVGAALATHPDAAVFHEIHGLDLELRDARPEEAREAYKRALELDPANTNAMLGLGRLWLSTDPGTALSFFDRAAAADPPDGEAPLQAARALLAAGRAEEARQRFEALLVSHPLEPGAAAELVALDLASESVTEQTLEWAIRAARLRGGPDAYEQLGEIYARLEQPEKAARAAEQAQQLRDRAAGAASRERPTGEEAAPVGQEKTPPVP